MKRCKYCEIALSTGSTEQERDQGWHDRCAKAQWLLYSQVGGILLFLVWLAYGLFTLFTGGFGGPGNY